MEKLKELIKNRDDAYEAYHQNEVETTEAITNFLKSNCVPEGVESKIDLQFNKWAFELELRGSIQFITDDPERIKKGWDTDFGSNFDISISENHITINKGTIGRYTLKDKYQIARDRMLVKIWDNHDAIVNLFNSTVKRDLFVNYYNAQKLLERAQDDIENAERERKYQEALTKLKSAKYIAEHNISDKYENDDYWTRKVIGKKHNYYNIFRIDKITHKTVMGVYLSYSWENKRLSLDYIISQITRGYYEVFQERPESYVELFEEASDK